MRYYGVYHAEADPALAATMANVCVTARWVDPAPLVAAGLTPVFQVETPSEALLRDPESAPRWPFIVESAERWQAAGVRPAGLWVGDELFHRLRRGDFADWPSLRGERVTASVERAFADGLHRYGQALKRLWPGVPLGSVEPTWDGWPVPGAWDFLALDVYHPGTWPVPHWAAAITIDLHYHEARKHGRPLVGVGQAFGGEGFTLPPPEMLTMQAEIIGAQPGVVGLIWYGLQFTTTGKVGIADDPRLIAAAQAVYQGRG